MRWPKAIIRNTTNNNNIVVNFSPPSYCNKRFKHLAAVSGIICFYVTNLTMYVCVLHTHICIIHSCSCNSCIYVTYKSNLIQDFYTLFATTLEILLHIVLISLSSYLRATIYNFVLCSQRQKAILSQAFLALNCVLD